MIQVLLVERSGVLYTGAADVSQRTHRPAARVQCSGDYPPMPKRIWLSRTSLVVDVQV